MPHGIHERTVNQSRWVFDQKEQHISSAECRCAFSCSAKTVYKNANVFVSFRMCWLHSQTSLARSHSGASCWRLVGCRRELFGSTHTHTHTFGRADCRCCLCVQVVRNRNLILTFALNTMRVGAVRRLTNNDSSPQAKVNAAHNNGGRCVG